MKNKLDRKLLTTLSTSSTAVLELYKTMGFTVEDITNAAFMLLEDATIGKKPNAKIFDAMSKRTNKNS